MQEDELGVSRKEKMWKNILWGEGDEATRMKMILVLNINSLVLASRFIAYRVITRILARFWSLGHKERMSVF